MRVSVVLFVIGLVGLAMARPAKKEAQEQFLRFLLRALDDGENAGERRVLDNGDADSLDKRGITFGRIEANHAIRVDPQASVSQEVCNTDVNALSNDCWFRIQFFTMTSSSPVEEKWTLLGNPYTFDGSVNADTDAKYRVKCCRVDGYASNELTVMNDGRTDCKEVYCKIPDQGQTGDCTTDDPDISNDINMDALQELLNNILAG